ncbi:MAG: hypothetical protein WC460_04110 [Patescibacteria group bacterium]
MRINKNSWHYRLVEKTIEDHRFHVGWNHKLPEKKCRYFLILLHGIFSYAVGPALIMIGLWLFIIHRKEWVYILLTFAIFAFVSTVFTLFGYGLHKLYKSHEEDFKKWFKKCKDKICTDVEYF